MIRESMGLFAGIGAVAGFWLNGEKIREKRECTCTILNLAGHRALVLRTGGIERVLELGFRGRDAAPEGPDPP